MQDAERYEHICRPAFAKLQEGQERILQILEGNGKRGLKATVDRNSMICNGMLWAAGVAGAILIGIAVNALFAKG